MKEKKKNRALWVVGSIVLTVVGFIVIPPIIDKVSTKAYKLSVQSEEIDIENLEPEIVKKSEMGEE